MKPATRCLSRLLLPVCTSAAALTATAAAVAAPYECLIEPTQVVHVSSPVEGVIEKVHVQRGERVSAGQPLVQLESRAEQSALALAKFRARRDARIEAATRRADYLRKKAERTDQMVADNFLSAEARDQARAELAIAESELREAVENRVQAQHELRQVADLLERRTLRSPFSGIVVDRMLNPGDLAEAGTGRRPVLKLAMVDPLRVEVVMPVEAYGKLKPGAKAVVMPEGLGGQHPARVTVVDSVFDPASGTFGVRLELPNPERRLPAGIRCKVEFAGLEAAPRKPAP